MVETSAPSPDAQQSAVARLLAAYRQDLPGQLVQLKATRREVADRVDELWSEALDRYDQCSLVAYALGRALNERHRLTAAERHDCIFEVLTRLHTQALLVGGEIRTLLRAGYAQGALARARTMHELVVVANFIRAHDQETAERFLIHEQNESCRLAEGYEEQALALGAAAIDPSVIAQLRARRDDLEQEYGRGFLSAYGWAGEALKPGNRKHEPTFRHLETAVDLAGGRPFYQLASKQVHVGSLGSGAHMAMVEQTRVYATAPNVRDLHLPANAVLLGLLETTFNCLHHGVEAYGDEVPRVAMSAFVSLIDEANHAFASTELKLQERYDEPR